MTTVFRWRNVAVATAAALGWLGIVAAQTQPPPTTQPAVQPATNTQPMQAIRAKDVLGSKVSLSGNAQAGTVDDIVFTDDGRVEYLIVANAQGQLVTVPWDAAKFNFRQRTATIEITPAQFQTIPTYTTTSYPQFFTPAYRTETYRYYGLTPGQMRRLDRQIDRIRR